MADNDSGSLAGTSEGGLSGLHGSVETGFFRVGSSTGDEFNTIKLPTAPIACFRVDDARFDFDSSFVASHVVDDQKDIRAELRLLVQLLKDNPQSPLSVFGHADPVGNDDYNKQLSGRRATVIYALLIANTNPDTAVHLWQGVAVQENWGASQRGAMQAFTGLPAGTADAALMKAYMQKLSPPELQLGKQDFLGQGADPKGKGDMQGCSEFNPSLIFSQQRNDAFNSANDVQGRNDANARNRRVLVLLFKKGTKIDINKWPCPRVSEGVAGCRVRFYPLGDPFGSGDFRRSHRLPDTDRTSEADKKTFACRFYDRLLTKSPCESPVLSLKIRLFDPQGRPLPFAPCLVTMEGKTTGTRSTGAPPSKPGVTPAETPGSPSSASKDDGYISVSVQKLPATVTLRWSRAKKSEPNVPAKPDETDLDDYEYFKEVVVAMPDDDTPDTTAVRLKNLGYDTQPAILIPGYGNPVYRFQGDYKPHYPDIVVDSSMNEPTRRAARTAHNAAEPVLREGSDIEMVR